jgi:PD-(D/E)XK endonuclease
MTFRFGYSLDPNLTKSKAKSKASDSNVRPTHAFTHAKGFLMNELAMKIKHHKRGEWAELLFMARAAERGLCVSKPWGDTSHYDFVVESEAARLLRVQVKW